MKRLPRRPEVLGQKISYRTWAWYLGHKLSRHIARTASDVHQGMISGFERLWYG